MSNLYLFIVNDTVLLYYEIDRTINTASKHHSMHVLKLYYIYHSIDNKSEIFYKHAHIYKK